MLISDERLPDSIAEARDQFPAAAIGPYFDVSLRGLLPTRTRDLIHRFVDAGRSGDSKRPRCSRRSRTPALASLR